MKSEKLLELIRFLKEKDLIQKYNDIYKYYDERYEEENPGFKLKELYTLTNEQADLIMSSRHDVEALFRLRMNEYGYDELMSLSVGCDSENLLQIVEEILYKDDSETYDTELSLIRFIALQTKSEAELENIQLFISQIANKSELYDCGLDLEELLYSLECITKCKTYNGANFISRLASLNSMRRICHLDEDIEYYKNVIDVVTKSKHNFQVEYIEYLLKCDMDVINSRQNPLESFDIDDRIAVLSLFNTTTNEDACNQIISTLVSNRNLIKHNSSYLIEKLVECASLEKDEELVKLSSITSIEDLETALMTLEPSIEIDEYTKVKMKKKTQPKV